MLISQGKGARCVFMHFLYLSLSLLSFQPSGKGPRLPEVYCVISRLGCFGLFSKVRDAVFLPPHATVTALVGVSAASLDEKNTCVRDSTRKGVQSKYKWTLRFLYSQA